jgi:hypothetical protein
MVAEVVKSVSASAVLPDSSAVMPRQKRPAAFDGSSARMAWPCWLVRV